MIRILNNTAIIILLLMPLLVLGGLAQETNAQKTTPISASPDKISSQTNHQKKLSTHRAGVSNVSDPNSDPNLVIAEVETFFRAPEKESKPFSLDQPVKLWRNRYHPQVSCTTFALLSYPYYPGGQGYTLSEMPALDSQTQLFNLSESAADPNGNVIMDQAKNKAAFNELRASLERCCDMVSRWRMINESPYTALEIVYAVELTKTGTGIYQTEPQLAINVKRTIGQIGRRNRQFDLISRLVYQSLLAGTIDKALLARMEKQITELESLLIRLTEQNDAISIKLGIGKINRQSVYMIDPEPINFSKRKQM